MRTKFVLAFPTRRGYKYCHYIYYLVDMDKSEVVCKRSDHMFDPFGLSFAYDSTDLSRLIVNRADAGEHSWLKQFVSNGMTKPYFMNVKWNPPAEIRFVKVRVNFFTGAVMRLDDEFPQLFRDVEKALRVCSEKHEWTDHFIYTVDDDLKRLALCAELNRIFDCMSPVQIGLVKGTMPGKSIREILLNELERRNFYGRASRALDVVRSIYPRSLNRESVKKAVERHARRHELPSSSTKRLLRLMAASFAMRKGSPKSHHLALL